MQQLADTAAKVQKIIQDMEVKLAAAIKERDNWTSHALQVQTFRNKGLLKRVRNDSHWA